MKESTVRTFRDNYHKALKANKTDTAIAKKLLALKRGRPLLLGQIDKKVKNFQYGRCKCYCEDPDRQKQRRAPETH